MRKSLSIYFMPCPVRCKGREGFTLIEVLVALAILGIGLSVILELFSGGLRSVKISEEYVKATWYGKEKMEEALATKDFTEGVTEGSFDSLYAWTLDVKRTNPSLGQVSEEDDLPVDVYQIILKVTWPSGIGQRTLQLESLRAFEKKED